MSRGPQGVRYAEVERETRASRVQVVLDLDGGLRQDVSTGLTQLDRWLESMAWHGGINLGIKAELESGLDSQYLVEDVGIAIGQAIRDALRDGDKIVRFADNATPCNESLVGVSVDLLGRGRCLVEMPYTRQEIGGVATQSIRILFQSICSYAGASCNVRRIAGENDLDCTDAAFIAFGRALGEATRVADPTNGS